MEDKVLMDSFCMPFTALHHQKKRSALALGSDGTAKDWLTFKKQQYHQNGKQQPLKFTQKTTSTFCHVHNYLDATDVQKVGLMNWF